MAYIIGDTLKDADQEKDYDRCRLKVAPILHEDKKLLEKIQHGFTKK